MIRNTLRHILLPVMLLLVGGMAWADDEFNPTNPPDPSPTYKLTTVATPAGTGYASGTGRYKAGRSVYVNTSSADPDYEFSHWELDGVRYTTSRSFYFTIPQHDVTLTAVYTLVVFDPANPAEPGANYRSKVYLESVPAEACSFSTGSGQKYAQGSTITITAYANQGFEFIGWYEGAAKIGTNKTLRYTVPTYNSTLEARFVFNPDSPADPAGSGQTNVDNTEVTPGDANGDGRVNVTDLQRVINIIAGNAETTPGADANTDDRVNVTDLQRIINIIAGN